MRMRGAGNGLIDPAKACDIFVTSAFLELAARVVE